MNVIPWFPQPADLSSRIRASGVCKAYAGIPVLYPTSFGLAPGDALALVGPNGSGKTTLLRLLSRLERPSDGTIVIPDSSRLGFLGHATYLYEDLSGLENLRFSARVAGLKPRDAEVGAALEAVDMRGAARDRVRTYSAGMKRRIGLARLILFQPTVLILDEPHASLDQVGQELVDSIIAEARDSGRIVVIASHDAQRLIGGLVSHVMSLERGRMTFLGSPQAWQARRSLALVRSDVQ